MSSGSRMKLMKPLFHPSIENVTVEGILHALSDPVRLAIYADLVAKPFGKHAMVLTLLSPGFESVPSTMLSGLRSAKRRLGCVNKFPPLAALSASSSPSHGAFSRHRRCRRAMLGDC